MSALSTDLRERLAALMIKMPDAPLGVVLQELAHEDPLIFCMVNRQLRGTPLTFDNTKRLTPEVLAKLKRELKPERYEREVKQRLVFHRPMLIQPMRDQHPHKVYQKARQIGISEVSITEVAHFLNKHQGRKWIYTFPREKQLNDFSASRIRPMFEESPAMEKMVEGTPGNARIQIGTSFMILRSAWESNLGEGVDADGVTFDEKDRMKEGVEAAFKESLSASVFGLMREVSTPSIPGAGVNRSFAKSDQRCWLMRCTKCGLEQEITYPENVIQMVDVPTGTTELPDGAYEYLCRKSRCRGLIDRMHGRWVAKFPDVKNIRGYYIPQMIAPWITATMLMQKKIEHGLIQLWTNYCLGLPAMGESQLVSELDLEQSCAGYNLLHRRTKDWDTISAGIDWGHLNWCTIRARNVHNSRFYVIGLKVIEDDSSTPLGSAKRMESYLAPFEPDIIVADAGYGKDRNAYLKRKFDPLDIGKFWACTYNPSARHSRTFAPSWSDPTNYRVLVDRTLMLKRTAQSIREREIGLPTLDSVEARLYGKHWRALVPLTVEEDGELYEEIKSSGDDHLAHADSYSFLGVDRLTRGGFFKFDFV